MLLRIAERTLLIGFALFWLPEALWKNEFGQYWQEVKELWEEM